MMAALEFAHRIATMSWRIGVTWVRMSKDAGWAISARISLWVDAPILLHLSPPPLMDMKLGLGLDPAPSTTPRHATRPRSPVTLACPLKAAGGATTALTSPTPTMAALEFVHRTATMSWRIGVTWARTSKDAGWVISARIRVREDAPITQRLQQLLAMNPLLRSVMPLRSIVMVGWTQMDAGWAIIAPQKSLGTALASATPPAGRMRSGVTMAKMPWAAGRATTACPRVPSVLTLLLEPWSPGALLFPPLHLLLLGREKEREKERAKEREREKEKEKEKERVKAKAREKARTRERVRRQPLFPQWDIKGNPTTRR